MDFSFREKSAAVSLLAVLGTYGYYFYFVLLGSGPTTPADMLVWMIGLVVVLVSIEVTFQSLIAAFNAREADASADERERLINLKSYRISYLILAAGTICTLGRLLFGSVAEPEDVTLLDIANLLLASLVISEAAGYGTQLYHYRRGVQ
jgi:hypothetical protein